MSEFLRRRRSPDLVVACALAGAAVLVSIVSPGGWLQGVVLVPFVLAAPGMAIAAAVFPSRNVELEDRIVYSFVFSISAAALGGLLVQIALGLGRSAWLCLLVVIVLAASAVAQRRGDGVPIQSVRPPLPPACRPAHGGRPPSWSPWSWPAAPSR